MTPSPRRAAIYARVSTLDQEPENQLAELRRYVAARGWTATVARPWMPFSRISSGASSMSWSVGGWIDSVGA